MKPKTPPRDVKRFRNPSPADLERMMGELSRTAGRKPAKAKRK